MNNTLEQIISVVEKKGNLAKPKHILPVLLDFHISYQNEVVPVEINGILKSVMISKEVCGMTKPSRFLSFEIAVGDKTYFVDYSMENKTKPYVSVFCGDFESPMHDTVDEKHLPLSFLKSVLNYINY